jgi:hypothetical protein
VEPVVGTPMTWSDQPTDVNARYVRLYARNRRGIPQVGFVAEVQIFVTDPNGEPVGGSDNLDIPGDGPDITPSGRYRPVGSRRSSNSPDQSSRLALDGDRATAWATSMSVAPSSGWVGYDLGGSVPIGRIRWMFDRVDRADSYRVQVSDDLRTWTTVTQHVAPPSPGAWIEVAPDDLTARFVRWYFTNPHGDANLGGLSEVRFYAPADD